MTDNSKQAFPVENASDYVSMTLREYFAGEAMNGMLGNSGLVELAAHMVAHDARLYADALIAELET